MKAFSTRGLEKNLETVLGYVILRPAEDLPPVLHTPASECWIARG